MKKAYFTALLVVLITGSLFGSAWSYLRAGRDKIMMPRNRAINKLPIQAAEYEQEKPVYHRRTSYRHAKPLGNRQGTLRSLNTVSFRLRLHCAWETWQREVSLWKHTVPQYAEEIWKRSSHRSFWFCLWVKLWQGNHIIIAKSSFSKNSVFKMHGFPSTL